MKSLLEITTWQSYFESKKHGEEFLFVSHQHGIANDGQFLFEYVLNGDWWDILPSSSDD